MMPRSRRSSRGAKAKAGPHQTAAFLAELHRQGARVVSDNGGVALWIPPGLRTLDCQTRIQVNALWLRALLRGLDMCLRLNVLEADWWGHLAAVAGNGGKAPSQRPDKGPEDAPRLSDLLDPPLPPESIPRGEPLAVDIESMTTDPPWMPGARLISVAFSALGKRWAYLATDREEVQRYLRLPHVKVFHASSFDLAYLVWAGFRVAGEIRDTLWERALAGGVGSKSLDALSPYRYAVCYPAETPDLMRVLIYNANDALADACVYRDAPADVRTWREHQVYRMYSRMAVRLAQTSCAGIPLLQDRIARLHLDHTLDLLDAEWRLEALTGFRGGWWGWQQVHNALGITGPTDEDTLRRCPHPAAPIILEWRAADKPLQRLRHWCRLDRLRGLFKLNQAWTGRVASSDENLQNVPRELRTCCGHPDYEVVSLDFSSAELVVAAEMTQCRLLLSWFREGRDPHKEAAAKIFHKPVDDVTDDDRAVGKVANFNLLYGGGAGTIIRKAAERGVALSWDEADTIVSEFFAMFPEIRTWQDAQMARMRQGLPITSAFDRTWSIPADDWHQRNMGLNAPIQSGASDITLLGLDRAWTRIEAQGRVINVVHDSVDVLIPMGTFDPAAWHEIARTIAGVDPRFPMQIEVAVGPDWGSTRERFTEGGAG
jgi:hypothetical protein